MSVPSLMIEASGPRRVRIGLSGEAQPESHFYVIHVNHLGRVRQETVWCTALDKDKINSFLEHEIENIEEGSIYVVHVSAEENYTFNTVTNPSKSIVIFYFKYEHENITHLSEGDYVREIELMSARNVATLYAQDGNEDNQLHFEIVFFLAGAVIDSPSGMEGVSVSPVKPGVSNASTFDAVSSYLRDRHSIALPTGEDVIPYLRYQPVFSINFHHIAAPDKNQAIRFSTQLVQDISTIIAMERGDRPFPLLVLVLERDTGNWELLPTSFDVRGNLLPPMFASTNMLQVEGLRPVFQRNAYVRLIAELYVQSLAERDRSFRILRQWSLLELIADRRIPATADALSNLDGSEIRLGSGKVLTTERKEGKVYAHLRGGSLPAIYQGTHAGHTRVLEGSAGGLDQGGGLVSLWEAVAASYSMRNDVAHDGRFNDGKVAKSERDNLCKELFAGTFGFLDHALDYAVWQEIALSEPPVKY